MNTIYNVYRVFHGFGHIKVAYSGKVVGSSPMIPKVCSADHWWSANPDKNQYFVLGGAPNYSKWSAHRKSLGTTALADINWCLSCLKK